MKRFFLIVLDSLGVGELPDSADYGDTGSNTLAAVYESSMLDIPNLQRLGLFNPDGMAVGIKEKAPRASYARMAEQSPGKDTTTGHWEMAGLILEKPFPTYPRGFPEGIIKNLEQATGRSVLCNKPYSGTQVINDYGRKHEDSGALIVYTSADSVLQIAAHEQVVPIRELYSICEIARKIMSGVHGIGRVIARPFRGEYPDYVRTGGRHDYSLPPSGPTMLDFLKEAGLEVIGVGKINDIFAGDRKSVV